jgi:tetratricopeptide (TPR) repeat protein
MAQTRTSPAFVIGLLVVIAAATCMKAQFGSLVSPGQAAQARSQDELDAYLQIIGATEARDVAGKVDAFALAFPKSELLGLAYQNQLRAFEQLNNFEGTLAAGEKALQANPDNLNTLLALAPVMASRADGRPDGDQLLLQAEAYARRALDGIEKTRLPRNISLEHWNVEKHQMQSQAHEVLGMVALQRRRPQTAIPELEIAISLSPAPDGVQFLRLGLAFAATGQKADAAMNLRRGAELGPEPVRALALAQLKKLQSSKSVHP